uniref:Gti1/Pac2 family-domain-containing protein n=1 Tax=Mycena chlorophos TaxID=658473 RepID=A0ABQ0L2V5_MYCCL|nr:predicted protein [Mycena chlorophos]
MSESRATRGREDADIRNISDALVVLEAVRRGILPLVTIRLSGSEREEVQAGNVFVWEESIEDGGLVRWTDGRRWSQSRVVGDCLFYQEKIELTSEEKEAKALRRTQRLVHPDLEFPPPARNTRPAKFGGLTKQSYSFTVAPGAVIGGSRRSRKWHLVAYTQWADRGSLPVIEHDPSLRSIEVPPGIFTKTRLGGRGEHESSPPGESASASPAATSICATEEAVAAKKEAQAPGRERLSSDSLPSRQTRRY